jgi:hypothetical protein
MNRRAFDTLTREFFRQFFVRESAVSDERHIQAMIGVLAFLVTPGFLIPLQLSGTFELAYLRFPTLVEPLTRLLATIFIAYAIVVVGVVAAFVWDALSLDQRDAVVIGPQPVPGGIVVGAKLAALSLLLLIVNASISVITAVPFAAIASSHKTVTAFGRHLVAHVVATTFAAVFIFSALVTVRGLLGMIRGGRAVVESLVQFALISALLCFTVLTPTALHVTFAGGRNRRLPPTIQMAPIPAWSPTNWFLSLYEVMRGTADGPMVHGARVAIVATGLAVVAAIAATIFGYRRQLRLALAAPGSLRTARALAPGCVVAALARWLAGGSRDAQGSAEFFAATVLRSRAHQTPIAISAAVGCALVVIRLLRAHVDIASFRHPAGATLAIPLMLMFWVLVGLRAACFVPSELPAGWLFRLAVAERSRSQRRAVRAALLALAAPPAMVLAALVAAPVGWQAIARHAGFVLLVVVALVDLLVLTIDFVPFTQPYRAGHAKLKTWWPIYLLGMLVVGVGMTRIEIACWSSTRDFLTLLACLLACIALLEVVGQLAVAGLSVHSREEIADDERDIAVLDIGRVVHRAHVGG